MAYSLLDLAFDVLTTAKPTFIPSEELSLCSVREPF